jgi:hypothetical protein
MKYLVYERRAETVVYSVEAASEEDAEARYLKDGEEVDSYLSDDREVEVEPGA